MVSMRLASDKEFRLGRGCAHWAQDLGLGSLHHLSCGGVGVMGPEQPGPPGLPQVSLDPVYVLLGWCSFWQGA